MDNTPPDAPTEGYDKHLADERADIAATAFTPDTPFRQRLADGHLKRTGHTLTGYYEEVARYTDTGVPILSLVLTCCGDAR